MNGSIALLSREEYCRYLLNNSFGTGAAGNPSGISRLAGNTADSETQDFDLALADAIHTIQPPPSLPEEQELQQEQFRASIVQQMEQMIANGRISYLMADLTQQMAS